MLPGDKSISHRYAMLAGFAEGTSRLTNFSTGADPHSSLGCMAGDGREGRARRQDDQRDRHRRRAARSRRAIWTAATLARRCACSRGWSPRRMATYRFIGDESLTVRPMERIRKPLEQMGARIELTEGHAPMTVHGTALQGD